MSELTDLKRDNEQLSTELKELKDSIQRLIDDSVKFRASTNQVIYSLGLMLNPEPKIVCEVTDKQVEEIKSISYAPLFEDVVQLKALFKILEVDYE